MDCHHESKQIRGERIFRLPNTCLNIVDQTEVVLSLEVQFTIRGVECLWRDMHRSVIQLYYRLFYFLEHGGLLNPLSDVRLFALHYVYLARINRSLAAFKDGWNMHSLRTENHHSPHYSCSMLVH